MTNTSTLVVESEKHDAVMKQGRMLRIFAVSLLLTLSACGGGGGGGDDDAGPTTAAPPPTPAAKTLDERLDDVTQGLTGDPSASRNLTQILPADDEMVKLGQLLFFSQTFSAGYDVSCGTCHHPDFAFSDGLSISVGVVPKASSSVGPGREIDPDRDLDPSADGGPNMHRHSITTVNAALLDKFMLYDGRVRVADLAIMPGGHGQTVITPESAPVQDSDDTSGLLEFQSKGPMVTDNEMRGFAYTEFSTGSEYREHLASRLRGEVDTEYNSNPMGPENWLELFRSAYDMPTSSAAELITIVKIQEALGAYVASQIFIDTPWKSYLEGDKNAINDETKRGALLFFEEIADGGLGCVNCHSGDRFTDENFYNVGFPQLGRGFGRTDTSDFGRWLTTREDEDRSAFRAIALLNITETGPYGHSGSFNFLDETLRYHADPRAGVDTFDFSLSSLQQFLGTSVVYTEAESLTRAAIAEPNFDVAEAMLPRRALSVLEVNRLVTFFEALTDPCVSDAACIGQWTPLASEDPDGHMLIRDESLEPFGVLNITDVEDYPDELPMTFPGISALATFADVQNCTDSLTSSVNTGQNEFSYVTDSSFGLNDPHGYSEGTWFKNQASVETTMIAGGISSAYINDDCWPDLVFAGGDASGLKFYSNVSGDYFQTMDSVLTSITQNYSGSAFADLNGDYRREMLFGNIRAGNLPVFSPSSPNKYEKVAAIPMSRPTYGISFAPLDDTGYPYFYLAHWAGGTGTHGTSPALWRNDGSDLRPWDKTAKTTAQFINQHSNFTPKFADFTGDGKMDLVVASDFVTSFTLRNISGPGDEGPVYVNETLSSVITDENGMGSTLIDIDNDSNLEWLVTAIYDPDGKKGAEVNWGQNGNRLYTNVSTTDQILFEDITGQSGVGIGYWGWGACAADFNNDGFTDIYHVNGFGYIPDELITTFDAQTRQDLYEEETKADFQNRPGNLFINNGDGTFDDRTGNWSLDIPSEGRGITCFDYDRDGDVDIAVLDHSTGLQFFENQVGHDADSRFVDVRVVGAAPNTDAIGAQVYVTANVGGGHGEQTQYRLSEANSNFNSQDVPNMHFGLGNAAIIDEIRVEWWGGGELSCQNVPVNQFIVIDEREGAAACP